MADDLTYLVTGASGHLGRSVLEHLLEAGTRRIVATTRRPETLADFARRGVTVRKADFDDADALRGAFDGAQRMLLISTDVADGTERRAVQHDNAVLAALAVGIEHIVYTSISAAETSLLPLATDHKLTERLLASSKARGLKGHTILRNNFYADLLLMLLPGAIATGKLVGLPADRGAAYISREDCARAASTALLSGEGTRILELSGPEVVNKATLARIASEITGREIRHVPLPAAALSKHFEEQRLAPAQVGFLLLFEQATGEGELALVTNDFEVLTRRPPTAVRDFLVAHRRELLRAA